MSKPPVPRATNMRSSLGGRTNGKAGGPEPDYFAQTIEDIDFTVLRQRGVRFLVLDVDHTLAPYNVTELSSRTQVYLRTVPQEFGIERIYLASNNRRDLTSIATSIDAVLIPATLTRRKPRREFFMNVLAAIQCKPHEAVMVGDKLVLDVWGANRVGMITILVDPMGRDMLLDRLILRRIWKKWYLRRSQS